MNTQELLWFLRVFAQDFSLGRGGGKMKVILAVSG